MGVRLEFYSEETSRSSRLELGCAWPHVTLFPPWILSTTSWCTVTSKTSLASCPAYRPSDDLNTTNNSPLSSSDEQFVLGLFTSPLVSQNASNCHKGRITKTNQVHWWWCNSKESRKEKLYKIKCLGRCLVHKLHKLISLVH
jgi:hypothetical protein